MNGIKQHPQNYRPPQQREKMPAQKYALCCPNDFHKMRETMTFLNLFSGFGADTLSYLDMNPSILKIGCQ
jgi:hypothetical protein